MLELNNDIQYSPDELFFERLEAFMDKSLADIRAFSEREDRPFEETRKYVAQWHSKYLFQPRFSESSHPSEVGSGIERLNQSRDVLLEASRILESLREVTGIESFLLAVAPHDPTNEGFLGGSVTGREFWRGLRGGADSGARAFKIHCMKRLESKPRIGESFQDSNDIAGSSSTTSKQSAKSIKLELYERVRKALRNASGIRNAEMKWTNPERLLTYGVNLVGWPMDIPTQNPSTLKASQNKRLLELLEDGTMKFVRIVAAASSSTSEHNLQSLNDKSSPEPDALFSWAIQYEESSPSSSQPPGAEVDREPATVPEQALHPPELPERPRKRPKLFGGDILRFSPVDDAMA